MQTLLDICNNVGQFSLTPYIRNINFDNYIRINGTNALLYEEMKILRILIVRSCDPANSLLSTSSLV
jgi:hypothetical protein